MNKLTTLGLVMLSTVVLAGCSLNGKSNTTSNITSDTTLPAADENTIHGCLMGGGSNCDIIMNPVNKATYGATVKKVCDMMPMAECKTYFANELGMMDKKDSGMGTHTMNHADMVQSEFDFITLMIPHHQEAVDTTTSLLTITQNPELITLGKGIIEAQTKEITMMKSWITTRYPNITYQGMSYMPMMRDTKALSASSTIEKMRTEDMILHHQGALDMARKLLKIMDTKDPLIGATGAQLEFRTNLRKFANDIITNQQKEIDTMKQILQSYIPSNS